MTGWRNVQPWLKNGHPSGQVTWKPKKNSSAWRYVTANGQYVLIADKSLPGFDNAIFVPINKVKAWHATSAATQPSDLCQGKLTPEPAYGARRGDWPDVCYETNAHEARGTTKPTKPCADRNQVWVRMGDHPIWNCEDPK